MNVLIIPEDFRNDQYILKPLFSRLFQSIVKRRVHVDVCRDPLLGGVGEALKSERIAEVIGKHGGMTDIFILCIHAHASDHIHIPLGLNRRRP